MGSAGWGGVWPRRKPKPGLLAAAPAAPEAAPPPSARRGLRVRPGDSRRRRGRRHLALGPAARGRRGRGPEGREGWAGSGAEGGAGGEGRWGGRRARGRGGGRCMPGGKGGCGEPALCASGTLGSPAPRPQKTADWGTRELRGLSKGDAGSVRWLGVGLWAPRQAGPKQRESPPRQVSVHVSSRAAPRGRHPRDPRIGAAPRPLAPPAWPPRECPLLHRASLQPIPRRGPGVSRGLTRSLENEGPGCSIKMNFLKRFPASKLKCNQSFNRGKEGSKKAGNGMTFFPWVRRPTAKFFHCVVYVPQLAFKRLEIIWI